MSNTDRIEIKENVALAPLTTLGVGGPARFFVRATSEPQVLSALEHARAIGLDVFVLGGGSNVLVSDSGFDGLVVRIALLGLRGDRERIVAQAGEDWDRFVERCVANDLAGVECLSGIPGLVGGTPVQNVGAYGQEVSDVIESVRCLDRTTNEIVELANADCGFSYRTSVFNSTLRDRYVVLAVRFALSEGGEPKIAYKDLREHFGDRRPTLADVRAAVLKIRRSKSMVIDPADPNSRSAGSFFKNPIVDRKKLEELGGDLVPHFAAGDGQVKVPAAWLIEQCGLGKGFRLGKAAISENHSLAIVNRGGATAADILALKEKIQASVGRKFGILLQPEPVFIGFDR